MGIVDCNGWFYWVKRVPRRYERVVVAANGRPISQVRVALRTDSRREAEAKAARVEVEKLAEWEALLAGDGAAATRHYEAARNLAQARGYPYIPLASLAAGDIADLVDRVLSLAPSGRLDSAPAVEAVLGRVPEALPDMRAALTEYYGFTATRHVKKNASQEHKWRLPRERAVKNFIDVVGVKGPDGKPSPPAMNEITRADALKFRDWWTARVAAGNRIETANKDIGHLSEFWNTWTDKKGLALPNPFARLRLEGDDSESRPPFSALWVKDNLLAPGALDKLNPEARDILLMMVNTGLRPSEITDAPLSDFEVKAPIPFFRVAANGRELKVKHTKRDIPLTGVSLDAAKRIVERKGINRYPEKTDSWSALVNKFMRKNNLAETPDHTAYSLRHYVENALLAAGVDDRIRADILGHEYDRPYYGDGGYLKGRLAALEKIAL